MSADLSNLTVGEFLHTLRQVVAEKGTNYVYPESDITDSGCRYRVDGRPSCLIGHALDRLGHVVPPELEAKSAAFVLDRLGVSQAAVGRVADMAQLVQDEGHTWGEALETAEAAAAGWAVSA